MNRCTCGRFGRTYIGYITRTHRWGWRKDQPCPWGISFTSSGQPAFRLAQYVACPDHTLDRLKAAS